MFVKGDKMITKDTKLIFSTDGWLAAKLTGDDPLLSEYDCVIIDEVHERKINMDLLLLLLKGVCNKRPEFKLIIVSATVDKNKSITTILFIIFGFYNFIIYILFNLLFLYIKNFILFNNDILIFIINNFILKICILIFNFKINNFFFKKINKKNLINSNNNEIIYSLFIINNFISKFFYI